MRQCRFTLLLAFIGACSDAPRDNPLDPLSPFPSPYASISGTVAIAGPGTPISGARITCLETGLSTGSDATGAFRIDRLSEGTWTFACTVRDFVPDTESVSLVAGGTATLSFSLNGAPTVVLQKVLTHKVDQYFPSPQYYVDVLASVTDPNGVTEVDSVWFVVDTLSHPLSYSATDKLFAARLFKYDLPTNTIQWLVGKPLAIRSRDIHGAAGFGTSFYVTRVIENGAVPLSPSMLSTDTTGTLPTLSWSPPAVTFTYTFTLTISRIEAGTQTVVWTLAGVSSVFENLVYPGDGTSGPLTPGDHVWTVSVVDEFGNTCRSKEAAFVVQ